MSIGAKPVLSLPLNILLVCRLSSRVCVGLQPVGPDPCSWSDCPYSLLKLSFLCVAAVRGASNSEGMLRLWLCLTSEVCLGWTELMGDIRAAGELTWVSFSPSVQRPRYVGTLISLELPWWRPGCSFTRDHVLISRITLSTSVWEWWCSGPVQLLEYLSVTQI